MSCGIAFVGIYSCDAAVTGHKGSSSQRSDLWDEGGTGPWRRQTNIRGWNDWLLDSFYRYFMPSDSFRCESLLSLSSCFLFLPCVRFWYCCENFKSLLLFFNPRWLVLLPFVIIIAIIIIFISIIIISNRMTRHHCMYSITKDNTKNGHIFLYIFFSFWLSSLEAHSLQKL